MVAKALGESRSGLRSLLDFCCRVASEFRPTAHKIRHFETNCSSDLRQVYRISAGEVLVLAPRRARIQLIQKDDLHSAA
jgi:hypothetical protein